MADVLAARASAQVASAASAVAAALARARDLEATGRIAAAVASLSECKQSAAALRSAGADALHLEEERVARLFSGAQARPRPMPFP